MQVLRKKRPTMVQDVENIVYHHDNASSHIASSTDLELALLGFQRISHPPYSPEFATLDFSYFPIFKEHLRGRRFEDKDDIMKAVLLFNRLISQKRFLVVFIGWVNGRRSVSSIMDAISKKNNSMTSFIVVYITEV